MIAEVVSACVGATVAGVATYVVDHVRMSKKDGLLEGTALIEMTEYPVGVDSSGLLYLNIDKLERVCRRLLAKSNPRAAVDLLYLAEHNNDLVEGSKNTVELLARVRRRHRRRFRRLVEPRTLVEQREHLLRQFAIITDGLGETFEGVPIEFVLHDVRDPLHSICGQCITSSTRTAVRRVGGRTGWP